MTEVGTITRVQVDTDANKILVDVSVSPRREHENIQYRTPGDTFWVVPEVGNIVEVSKTDNGQPVAHAPHNTPPVAFPNGLTQGDVAIRLNSDTVLHLDKQSDGTYDIDLKCDGEMNIVANQIYVGDSNNSKAVLTEDAVFEYEDSTINDTSDGSGSKSTTTKTTTTVSNGEITTTEVE